jgi:hypothetical protein
MGTKATALKICPGFISSAQKANTIEQHHDQIVCLSREITRIKEITIKICPGFQFW